MGEGPSFCRPREGGDPYAVSSKSWQGFQQDRTETGYGSPPSRGRLPQRFEYSAPPPSSGESMGRGGVNLLRNDRNEIGPRLPPLLAADTRVRIPGAVAAVAEPVPDARIAVRNHHPGGPAERAGKVCGRVAHGHDGIAGG